MRRFPCPVAHIDSGLSEMTPSLYTEQPQASSPAETYTLLTAGYGLIIFRIPSPCNSLPCAPLYRQTETNIGLFLFSSGAIFKVSFGDDSINPATTSKGLRCIMH